MVALASGLAGTLGTVTPVRNTLETRQMYNGLLMPGSKAGSNAAGVPFHLGSHPNYTAHVQEELLRLERKAALNGWSDARAAQEARALAQRLAAEIMSKGGGKSLNKSF